MVEVAVLGAMCRFMALDRVDHWIPREHLVKRQLHVESRHARPMRHRVADGDALLAASGKFRPPPCDRLIQVEPALLHEKVEADRHDPFRAGEDHGARVVSPRGVVLSICGPGPDVHNRTAVAVDRARRPEIVPLLEVGTERVHHGSEPRFDNAVNQVRHGAAHPFTEPCRSAVTNWRWKIRKTISVGARISSEPADRSGMLVA